MTAEAILGKGGKQKKSYFSCCSQLTNYIITIHQDISSSITSYFFTDSLLITSDFKKLINIYVRVAYRPKSL